MRKARLLLIVVMIVTLFTGLTLNVYAADNDYKTALSVQTSEAAVTTNESYTEDYTFGIKLHNLSGGDPTSVIATMDFGVGNGNHYLRVIIEGRSINAYVLTQTDASEGAVAVDVPDGFLGTDMVLVEDYPYLWVRNGTEAKINFSVNLTDKTLTMSAGFATKAYSALNDMCVIDLSDKFTSNPWFDAAETLKGAVRILPNYQSGDVFEILEIQSNESLLDLYSDVTLSNNKHFKKDFILPAFTVDGTALVKKVSPFEISSAGFGEEDEVFKVDLRFDRLATAEAIWGGDMKFGLLFGMQSDTDTMASENVLSLSFGFMAALNIKQGDIDVELGNNQVVFRGNDVVPWVKVEVTGYGDNSIHVKYILSVGHANEVVYQDTVEDVDFNGKMAVFADWTTFIAGDGINYYDTAIKINTVQNPEEVTLSSTEFTLKEGATKTLTATVLPLDASNKNVTWTSSDDDVATVNESGLVAAVGYGTATITATSIVPSVKAVATVSVVKAVTDVTLNKTTLTLYKNASETLTATVQPSGQTIDDVEWSSSDTNVATVDQNGLVTAVANGTATITATSADDATKSATCTITVKTHVTSVVLDKNEHSFTNPAQTVTLTTTVYPAGASDKSVSWESSDTSVATVADGVVTAVANGTATITVTTTDGSITDTCTITVTTAVTGIALNKTTASIEVNKTETLVITVTPATASNKQIVWTSSDESVATVNANGVVKAKAKGTATITATSVDGDFEAACEITVTKKSGCGASVDGYPFAIALGALACLVIVFKNIKKKNKINN